MITLIERKKRPIFSILVLVGLAIVIPLAREVFKSTQADSRHKFRLLSVGEFDSIASIAWNNDGTVLAIGSDHNLYRYEFPSGKSTFLDWWGGGPVEAITWSPDNNFIAAANSPDIEIWYAATGKIAKHLETHIQYRIFVDVEWSPDSNMLAAASSGGPPRSIVRIWDTNSGKEIFTITADMTNPLTSVEFGERFSAVAWSPDSNTLAVPMSWNHEIYLWDTSTWTISKVLSGHTFPISALAWEPSSQLVSGDINGSIIIWNVENSVPRIELDAFDSPVNAISWNVVQNAIAIAGEDSVTILDLTTEKNETIRIPQVNDVSWNCNGTFLAIAHNDGVSILRAQDTILIRRLAGSGKN